MMKYSLTKVSDARPVAMEISVNCHCSIYEGLENQNGINAVMVLRSLGFKQHHQPLKGSTIKMVYLLFPV